MRFAMSNMGVDGSYVRVRQDTRFEQPLGIDPEIGSVFLPVFSPVWSMAVTRGLNSREMEFGEPSDRFPVRQASALTRIVSRRNRHQVPNAVVPDVAPRQKMIERDAHGVERLSGENAKWPLHAAKRQFQERRLAREALAL